MSVCVCVPTIRLKIFLADNESEVHPKQIIDFYWNSMETYFFRFFIRFFPLSLSVSLQRDLLASKIAPHIILQGHF